MIQRTSPRAAALICAILAVGGPAGGRAGLAAELQPRTVAAFNRYVQITESRIADEQAEGKAFLHGTLDDAALRKGELVIKRIETREKGREIEIPDGIVHHWIGTVFVPGVTVDQAVALLQDYDRHAEIYTPNVARSKLVSRDGATFRVYLRFFMKQVLTVVVNSDHEARFERPRPDRAASRIVSTRIAEVEEPGTPREREKPVGNDGGYLWRLNSYWRFVERGGGTYIQCESISLTRGMPIGLGWLIGPFVNSIPKETLTFTLETTRKALARSSTVMLAPPPAAPARKPTGLAGAIADGWAQAKGNITASAKQMPEDGYAVRPVDTVRTFGQILAHVAGANYVFCAAAKGEKSPYAEEHFEKSAKTKAEIMKALAASIAYCDPVYTSATDAGLAQMVANPFGSGQQARAAALLGNTGHLSEHYGNLVTYFRIKGMVPPSSQPQR